MKKEEVKDMISLAKYLVETPTRQVIIKPIQNEEEAQKYVNDISNGLFICAKRAVESGFFELASAFICIDACFKKYPSFDLHLTDVIMETIERLNQKGEVK